ncbi:MAG: acyltransferase [Oligoflexia bacterium]|nr:acyltransferase [Oligoflexia bacterium]
MAPIDPVSRVARVTRVIKERPLFLFQYVRTVWLFQRTRTLIFALKLVGLYPEGIRIGERARIQRLRCLRTELPHARVSLGERSIVYEHARIESYGHGQIEIGPCSILGDIRISCRSRIKIGARFLSSWNVFIQDFDPHPIDPVLRRAQVEKMCGHGPGPENWEFPTAAVTIGDDVWLGANVTILKGARIGSGSIVAAGSVVVSGDWPERSILAGNPAKVVKTV